MLQHLSYFRRCPASSKTSSEFLNGVGREEKGDLDDKRVLSCRQDNPEVAIMAPSVGTLNQF